MACNQTAAQKPTVIAVCLSSGGVPKVPQSKVRLTKDGIEGDGRDHAKHEKPSRAISLFDEETLLELCAEGYDLVPGSIGENVTLRNVHVQRMAPGTVLQMGQVKVRLEEPRKPCFVLDVIDPKLKDDIVGRCGYMASVLGEGDLSPGAEVVCLPAKDAPPAH